MAKQQDTKTTEDVQSKPDSLQGKPNASNVYDPVLFYRINGLTALSNNTAIIPRDSAGNIIIRESSTENSFLIIEPTTRTINKQSFLNTVQTNFQYFSLPTIINVSGSIQEIDLPNIDLEVDPIYSRYKPSEPRKILTSTPSGILMDEVVDGIPARNPNQYFINKQIKNSGANLRFRVKLQHRFDTPDAQDVGTAFFYISKTTVQDGLNRTYLGPFFNSNFENTQQQNAFIQLINDIILNSKEYCQLGENNTTSGNIKLLFKTISNAAQPVNSIMLTLSFITLLKNALQDISIYGDVANLKNTNIQIDILRPNLRSTLISQLDEYENELQQGEPGKIGQYGVQDLYIDVTIPNSSLSIGDIFGITAIANINEQFKYHTINSDTSYWSITNADKPVDDWNLPLTNNVNTE